MLKQRALTTTILSAAALSIAGTAVAHAQVDVITVTATKRESSTQDIPVAVNAMDGETLEQLGVNVFTDYLQQMPGVTAGGGGPGQPIRPGRRPLPLAVVLALPLVQVSSGGP